MFYAVLALGAAVTVLFLFLRVTKGGLPAMYCKAAASVCFIATAFTAFSMNRENFGYGALMIMGLIFGLLGDIFLDLKYVYEKDKDIFLYSGFISFACGHTFFVTAIFREYESFSFKYLLIAVGVCLLVGAFVLLTEKPMKLTYGKFKPAVTVYTIFVSMTLVVSVLGLILYGASKRFILLTVGAAAFLLSDLVLSPIYFAKDKNTKFNVILNHTLYYFAQFTLASTILFG